ncbi:MAG: NYN domain-containing protein [Bellilinea sp.]
MPYMIDGHNLIPKVRGLSLQNLDDELELIKRLQTFCRVRRQAVEVYFDKAVTGRSGTKSFGMVKAHFVPASSNADTAIRQALKRLERKARNWQVVSSDRQVQAEARSAHAAVITAEEFAAQLEEALMQAVKSPSDGQRLSVEEVDAWLELFNRDRDETAGP